MKGRVNVPAYSPDGATVAAIYSAEPGKAQLAIIGITGGEIRNLYDLPPGACTFAMAVKRLRGPGTGAPCSIP